MHVKNDFKMKLNELKYQTDQMINKEIQPNDEEQPMENDQEVVKPKSSKKVPKPNIKSLKVDDLEKQIPQEVRDQINE